MEEAKTCAYKHDSRGVYQIIRRIAPKQSRQRLQLRATDGRMLTPTEEADALEEHFAGRFRETNLCLLRQAMGPWPAAEAPSLNPELLRDQLMQTPRRKAVPCNYPPSAVWRCCADIIAPWVCDTLRALWATDQVMVPSSWADVDLALVPKPAKAGRKPEDHRPIGLSCPLGKKVLSCLLPPMVPNLLCHIRRYPQFAYQQGRSQYDALRRAFQHCHAVRRELELHRHNIHARKAGHKPVALYGAIMVTVDLSQAFDRMPRHQLLQGLRALDIPNNLVSVIVAWHANIRYHIHHAGETRTFPATRGIRQGCSASPLLWLLFSHVISTRLEARWSYEVLCKILTVFADDYFVADTFCSLAELEALLDCISVLFAVLQAFGMQASAAKSKAVLTLRGTLSPQVRRRFIRPTPDGKVLQIQGSHQTLTIPLRSQFTYLGAQVSYHAFENQTLQYRLDKGTAAYSRLGSVLKGRHHLSVQQRVSLWQSCVWSTISYGLTTCGLTPAGHKSLETTVLRHLRAILRVPVHLTHTTNVDVARQAGVGLPYAILNRLLDAEKDRKQASAWSDPLTYGPQSSWWQHLKNSLQPPVESVQLVAPDLMIKPYTCPTCGVSYATRAAMLAHITKSHSDPKADKVEITFDKAKDAIGGMPQCAACGKQFPTWQLLQRHVVGNYCAAKHADQPRLPAAPVVPAAARPELFTETVLQTLLTKHGTNAIYHLNNRQVYDQHCMQCGQWIASSKAMKLHYKHSHPDLLSAHASTALKLCASYTPCGSPCLYCNHTLAQPKAHKPQCSVLWQFCIGLVAHYDQHGISGDPNRGDLRIPCEGECRRLWPAPVGGLGKRPRPFSNGSSRGGNNPQNQRGSRSQDHSGHIPLVKAMGRLLLRQETQLQILKQNSAWLVFLKPGQEGPMALLHRTAEAYRETSQSRLMEAPLRAILLSTLFQALLTCLQNMVAGGCWLFVVDCWLLVVGGCCRRRRCRRHHCRHRCRCLWLFRFLLILRAQMLAPKEWPVVDWPPELAGHPWGYRTWLGDFGICKALPGDV